MFLFLPGLFTLWCKTVRIFIDSDLIGFELFKVRNQKCFGIMDGIDRKKKIIGLALPFVFL